MERISVDSSNVKSLGYNPASQVLEVEFIRKGGGDGPVYSYDGVPPEKWQGLMASASKGHYLNAEIKGHYTCTKISG